MIHVSTAYCNPQLKHISEEVNPNNGDPEGIIALCKVCWIWLKYSFNQSDVKKSDPELLNSKKMTAQIIGNKPNTYTFTKVHSQVLNVISLYYNFYFLRPWEKVQ